MDLTMRPMLVADKPAVLKILSHLPEFTPEEVDVAEEVIDAYLEDPRGSGYRVLVGEIEGAIIGYVVWGPTPLTQGTWDVYWLAVAQQKQGAGLGGMLLAAAEADIRHDAGRMAVIETSSRPEYEKTRRFHTSHGYRAVCEVPDFYSPGDSKVMFVKRFDIRPG